MKKSVFALCLAVGMAGAQNQPAVTRPLVHENGFWVLTMQGGVDAAATGQLRIESVGNVNLRGTAAGQTTYTLTVRVKAGDAREAEAQLQRFNVKTGTEGGWAYIKVTPPRLVSGGLDLTVSGPRALRRVWAETRGGNVQASDWDGDLEARSSGGQISVDGIRGASELRTAGGNIRIGTVRGAVRSYSGGGSIQVENAGAEAWLETAGGEIVIHQADGPIHASTGGGNVRIEKAANTVYAHTAGGLIQVEHSGGAVTAETAGGAIQVNSAKGVRCESAGGAIRLQNVAGALHASTSAGSILAELASGTGLADSMLSTSAGDITVFIPSNMAMTVHAINESGGSGGIISDFPQVRAQANSRQGNPMLADGALNGGGPVLRVNVQGGTIYLRRAK